MNAMTKDIYNLHRVDTSQLAHDDGVSVGGCRVPICQEVFGDSNCALPACSCHAKQIKASAWPPIQFAGVEPRTQDEHAEHLELTRPTRTGSDFRFLLGLCVAVALITTLAILSSPELVAAIIGNWRLK